VVSGYSAAALLDAQCAPRRDTPAEVTVVGGEFRGVAPIPEVLARATPYSGSPMETGFAC